MVVAVRPELDRLRCRRLVLLRPPQARCDVGRVRAVVSHEYGPVVRVEGPSKPVFIPVELVGQF